MRAKEKRLEPYIRHAMEPSLLSIDLGGRTCLWHSSATVGPHWRGAGSSAGRWRGLTRARGSAALLRRAGGEEVRGKPPACVSVPGGWKDSAKASRVSRPGEAVDLL